MSKIVAKTDMQVVRSSFFDKSNVVVTSAVKNASCNRGWLRFVVECLFGMVTVASFILIVILAMRSPYTVPDVGPRCELRGCRVICTETPYYDEFEDNIVFALSVAERICDRVLLTLNYPFFTSATLPTSWLSRLRTDVHEFIIFGGNLQQISSEAFMSQFGERIENLVLENITITRWKSDMLVGLSSLEDLCIKRSVIHEIDRNALESVDDTLETLTITMSGQWDPSNVTGTANLEFLDSVDFSSNHFGNILGKHSFSRLNKCRFLYLNSCRISAISLGVFDYMHKIEVLFLNNNYITTISPGLFNTMMVTSSPRIHLQDNLWLCDCTKHDLIRLSSKGMLVVDPVCYSPDYMRGKYVSSLEEICHNDTKVIITESKENEYEFVYTDGVCRDMEAPQDRIRLISPVSSLKCSGNGITTFMKSVRNSKMENNRLHNNKLISPTFAVMRDNFSMFEISSNPEGTSGYGLLWYQSKCPSEIYCLNALPNFLRVYNINRNALYIFCPLILSTDSVLVDKCISYSIQNNSARYHLRFLFYFGTALACLTLGALGVYALIRKYPSLLRGNKRILVVKHKNVDALILPPNVASRAFLKDDPVPDFNDKGIFVMYNSNCLSKMNRTKSVRSTKSNVPSYISALEPTETQLAEWRLRHLDNISTVTSVSMDVSAHWITEYNDDNSLYYSFTQGSVKSSESLK